MGVRAPLTIAISCMFDICVWKVDRGHEQTFEFISRRKKGKQQSVQRSRGLRDLNEAPTRAAASPGMLKGSYVPPRHKP